MKALETVAKAVADNYKVKVIFQGSQARTDGKTIILPSLPQDPDEMSETLVSKFRGFCDHEIGHVKFTDMNVFHRHPELREDKGLKNMLNIIEDVRIERAMIDKYIGCKINMQNTLNTMIAEQNGRFVHSALNCLMAEAKRYVCGYDVNMPDYKDALKSIFGEDVFEKIANCRTTEDAFVLARTLKQDYEEQKEKQEKEEQENGAGEGEGSEGEQTKTEADTQNDDQDSQDEESGDDSDEKKSKSVKSSEDNDENEESDESEDAQDEEGEGENEESEGLPEKFDGVDFEDYKDSYEEIKKELEEANKKALSHSSKKYVPFSTAYDKIVDMPLGDTEEYDKLKAMLGSLTTFKTRLVNMFKSQTAARWGFDKERGKINNAKLATVETGNKRVFKKKEQKEAIDTAVTFLVDFSGSMYRGVGGVSKLQAAMSTVVLFLETLAQTKVKSEVLGFTTGSRVSGGDRGNYSRFERINMYNVKGFEESMNLRVKQKVAGYGKIECRNNLDGESLEIAYNRLKGRKEQRKILFILSDGEPLAHGDVHAQYTHLKNVAKRIEADKDVELVAIGFMHEGVRQFYKNHTIINSIDGLAQEMFGRLEKILKI